MPRNFILLYLARQSLPLRGAWDSSTGTEESSNFFTLLKLRSEDDHILAKWIEKDSDKYTSPTIQNELIEVRNVFLKDV